MNERYPILVEGPSPLPWGTRTNERRNEDGNEAAAAFHVHDNEENCAEL